MKIVHVETILESGPYVVSAHWALTRKRIHGAVRRCSWPPGSKKFTIYPENGKKRGEGNGVVPIKNEFIRKLRRLGWTIEGPAKNHLGQDLGDFEAVLPGPHGQVVVEWEAGNILIESPIDEQAHDAHIKRPHRSRYPCYTVTQALCLSHGPDREEDAESYDVPRIPKATDGRSAG